MKASWLKNPGVALTLIALVVALIAWLAPFSPIGPSPLAQRLTPTSTVAAAPTSEPTIEPTIILTPAPQSEPVTCGPILLSEDFDEDTIDLAYVDGNPAIVRDGRLRFVINQAKTGNSYRLYGQYEEFSLWFEAYPLGDIFDASVNVLFLAHSGGLYEYQIRLRQHQLQMFKTTHQDGQPDSLEGSIGWHEIAQIDLGRASTTVQLDVKRGVFVLWVNDQQVHRYEDPNPFLRGEIQIGIGAGEVAPISMAIDNIQVCAY